MNAHSSPGESSETPPADLAVSTAAGLTPWSLAIDAVVASLESDTKTGLSDEQANCRLGQFGPNQIREAPPRSALAILLAQFLDWMIGLLIAAAVVSALDGVRQIDNRVQVFFGDDK